MDTHTGRLDSSSTVGTTPSSAAVRFDRGLGRSLGCAPQDLPASGPCGTLGDVSALAVVVIVVSRRHPPVPVWATVLLWASIVLSVVVAVWAAVELWREWRR